MPYPTLKDINPSLKGIRPRIDLEQANQIAAQADAIGAEKGGWGIAIKNFKKTHTVRGGKWTKREVKKTMDNPQDKKETAQECYLEAHQIIPLEVVSFTQLQALQQAGEVTESLQETANDFSMMLNNIIGNPEVTAKLPAIETLTGEFLIAIRDQLATEGTPEATPVEAAESLAELAESEPTEISGFAEMEGGDKTDLAVLNVKLVRPGWGNTRDNNYYPEEMLQKNAEKFIGAKMYESDHRPEEKSTRTWVSTISGISGFAEDGAPVARVVIHDPGFAQRVRNLNEAKLLDKLECSILASGKTVPGFELMGRKGQRVTEIVEVASVDWVTRAGAGGHALNMAETEPVSNDPAAENVAVVQSGGTITEDKTAVEEVTTEKQVEEVTPPVEVAAVISEKQEPEPEVKELSAEAVKAMLEMTHLPEITKKRFIASVFKTEEELKEAIEAEKKYISELTGAGKPFGLSETAAKAASETKGDPNAVIEKYFYPNRR
jgi:hypothetical protein